MKNLHLIPTDKPSKLHLGHLGLVLCGFNYGLNTINGQHIYITSDEKIKEGDWVIAIEGIWKNTITKITGTPITDVWRKIILTTDYDLIKDGVQAIDDEFLWWFSENPNCEFVEVSYGLLKPFKSTEKGYMIHLPDNEVLGEPKQETLEEAIKREYESRKFKSDFPFDPQSFRLGAKWQSERMYSEEGVLKILRQFNKDKPKLIFGVEEWFEQFKNK